MKWIALTLIACLQTTWPDALQMPAMQASNLLIKVLLDCQASYWGCNSNKESGDKEMPLLHAAALFKSFTSKSKWIF